MSKLRSLAVIAALAAVCVITPAAAQADPPSDSSVSVVTNGWKWND